MERLNNTDMAMLKNLADGLTTQQVADKLHYSHSYAKKRRQEVMDKFDVPNTDRMIALAFAWGILQPADITYEECRVYYDG